MQTCLNVCRRVSEVHSKGFVHNDLKSNNLILHGDWDVSVIDLGNALEIGTIFGYDGSWRFWLAPEMYAQHPLSVQSDIYSVGVVLSEIQGKVRIGHGFPKLLKEVLDEDPARRLSLEQIMERLRAVQDACRKMEAIYQEE